MVVKSILFYLIINELVINHNSNFICIINFSFIHLSIVKFKFIENTQILTSTYGIQHTSS